MGVCFGFGWIIPKCLGMYQKEKSKCNICQFKKGCKETTKRTINTRKRTCAI